MSLEFLPVPDYFEGANPRDKSRRQKDVVVASWGAIVSLTGAFKVTATPTFSYSYDINKI